MKIVGVTGSMGSGKTSVSREFSRLGALVVDADRIARGLLNEPRVKNEIAAVFGGELIRRGRVDRKALARIVFSEGKNLRRLNAIIHPGIIERIRKRVKGAGKRVVIVDAPLLIESGFWQEVDAVVLVACRAGIQLDRLAGRGYSPDEAKRRIKTQMPARDKRRRADFMIANNGSRAELAAAVRDVWRKIKK
ncbi:MAG: dephospho-CoA kinase [Candidatus Omnitrophota bacterium]